MIWDRNNSSAGAGRGGQESGEESKKKTRNEVVKAARIQDGFLLNPKSTQTRQAVRAAKPALPYRVSHRYSHYKYNVNIKRALKLPIFFSFLFSGRCFHSSLVDLELLCHHGRSSTRSVGFATDIRTCVCMFTSRLQRNLARFSKPTVHYIPPTPSSKGERGQKPKQKKWATPRRPYSATRPPQAPPTTRPHKGRLRAQPGRRRATGRASQSSSRP